MDRNIDSQLSIIHCQLSIGFGYRLKPPPAKYLIRAEIGQIPGAAEH